MMKSARTVAGDRSRPRNQSWTQSVGVESRNMVNYQCGRNLDQVRVKPFRRALKAPSPCQHFSTWKLNT
jgi:hypothetical protein